MIIIDHYQKCVSDILFAEKSAYFAKCRTLLCQASLAWFPSILNVFVMVVQTAARCRLHVHLNWLMPYNFWPLLQSMQYFFLCARFLLAPVVSRVRLYLTFFLIRKHARPCRPMTLQYFVTKANKEISSSCRDIQKFCLYQQIEKLI